MIYVGRRFVGRIGDNSFNSIHSLIGNINKQQRLLAIRLVYMGLAISLPLTIHATYTPNGERRGGKRVHQYPQRNERI